MSSPVHHPKDLDAALRYAPPWARETAAPALAAEADPPPEDRPVEDPPAPATDGGDEEPTFVGDQAAMALRRRLSLDPEMVPAPPAPPIPTRPSVDGIAFRLCAVAGIAAAVAWAVSSPTAKPPSAKLAEAAPPPAITAKSVKLVEVRAQPQAPPVQTALQTAAPPAPAAALVADDGGGFTRPAALTVPLTDAPLKPARTLSLSANEVAMLVKRGKEHLMNGDISSARLLLRRAAEAGNADAALALGSTFDPTFIARLGAIGVATDAAKAREWYQKAAQLGSSLATQQLATLARAGQ
jgi:hypothetical protein